jgi:hypothetical protein
VNGNFKKLETEAGKFVPFTIQGEEFDQMYMLCRRNLSSVNFRFVPWDHGKPVTQEQKTYMS